MADIKYTEWELDDIIKFCVEHKEVAWLKATAAKQVPCKIYPKKKVVMLDKVTGEPKRNKKGELRYTNEADKSQEPKIEMRNIPFVQLKAEFIEHFGLGAPKKAKEPNMYDKIANL